MSLPSIEPELDILSIREVIQLKELTIPVYQRPYTWRVKHVRQLLTDIKVAMDNQTTYRIGTIIMEKEVGDTLNIVDGQQRLVTLAILLYVLENSSSSLLKADFSHVASRENIHANHFFIVNWITGLKNERDAFLNYLLGHCEMVSVTLSNLSEAFQFFDAQNSRGVELDPTDLLKAFHLREMNGADEPKQTACVKIWEAIGQKRLNYVIGTYLYRIRRWSNGKNAGRFTKEEIDEFKGFTMTGAPEFPYLLPIVLTDTATHGRQYPFQLTQMIINGQRFFELVKHYDKMLECLFDGTISEDLKSFHLDHAHYPEDGRTGDQFVKTLYKSAMLCYYDRFGKTELENVWPLLFMWAYKRRLENTSVRYLTPNSYVHTDGNNVFRLMQDSCSPEPLFMIREGLRPSRINKDIAKVRAVYINEGLNFESQDGK